jgi:hypothetical protein
LIVLFNVFRGLLSRLVEPWIDVAHYTLAMREKALLRYDSAVVRDVKGMPVRCISDRLGK